MAKRKPTPSVSGARDDSRPASVIFYNADLGMVSPAVSDSWSRPVQELLRESDAMLSTNFPGASCARFIGWYLAQPVAHGFSLGVHNLPVSIRDYDGDEAGPSADWHDCLLAEVDGWDPDAVLVRLDGLTITRGGRLLWRADWVQRASGQSFSPVGGRRRAWIARQLAAAGRFVAAMSPADAVGPLTLDSLDRAWAAWLPQVAAGAATIEADPATLFAALHAGAGAVAATLDAVGVQFGQFLVDGAGFEWAVAADSRLGSELVVRALPGRGDVLVYPVKFVEKRWFGPRPEAGFLSSSFEAIRDDVAAVAGGRPAKHWPW
jgi:hypothetical protein